MQKRLVVFGIIIALACIVLLWKYADNYVASEQEDLKKVEQVGVLPDEFKEIVANNVFEGVAAFDGRVLKAEELSVDKEHKSILHRVWMMDTYGKELAEYTCQSDDAYVVTTLTATADGGFLFVLGFQEHFNSEDGWASDKGVVSRVIKCDSSGKLQFDTALEGIANGALQYCFEKNEQFYFFGDLETPETKQQGVYSSTDIYMMILDKEGKVLESHSIAGSDYDDLSVAEISGENFVLSILSQSDDGDFEGSESKGYPENWVITVNDKLEIMERKIERGRDLLDERIGERKGKSVYISDRILKGFDTGTPNVFIDYGDFYLIVSTNITGIYENKPMYISSIWYYKETVYSAYDYNGKLLFRASVDSSPDYDEMVNSFFEQ